jgi:hypothetical protein
MPLADFNTLAPDIADGLVTCPEPTIVRAVRQALREFCTRTQIWRSALAPLDLFAGIGDYDLDPPYAGEVAQVREVHAGDRALRPTRVDAMQRLNHWRDTESDTLEAYLLPSPAVIRFYPKPKTDQAGAVVIRAALRPTRAATEGPDWLLDQWGETLAAGARFRLLSMERWRDAAGAKLALAEFQSGLSDARLQVAHGHSRAPLTVRVPFFAGV